jgi:predicted secreted protein
MKFINTVNRYLMKNNSLAKYSFSALLFALSVPVPALAKNIIAAPHYSATALQHQSVTEKPAVNYSTAAKPLVLNMSKASEIKVYLKSNATTGYSWFLADDSYAERLTAVDRKYVAPTTKLMGASGYEVWTFKAKNNSPLVPAITKINFAYARPWEANPAKNLVITVFMFPKS